MRQNFTFANINEALPALCSQVLLSGDEFGSRAGLTRDLTHIGVTLTRPWEREITLPSRRHNLAAQIAETMWVLSGRDDVEWLERYLPRAPDFSDDGRVWRGAYGKRLRRWPRRSDVSGGDVIDQLAHVVHLLQEDINTRRAVIAIYDPEVDTAPGKDIPCNDFLTFSCRNNQLDVGVTIRSNDLIWGWSGVNAFEWSALQEIVARILGVQVGRLHFSITSLHLYEQHWDRAHQIASAPEPSQGANIHFKPLPGIGLDQVDDLFRLWFEMEHVIRNDPFSGRTAALVGNFPEPMLRSWLRILLWWWTSNDGILLDMGDSRLAASASVGVQPKNRLRPPLVCDVYPDCALEHAGGDGGAPIHTSAEKTQLTALFTEAGRNFAEYVCALHAEKHAAYGDSWKRRGEMLGIMANIARKIDRLGGSSTSDESTADTAIDLLVYLAKYRWWLVGEGAPVPLVVPFLGDPEVSNALIARVAGHSLNIPSMRAEKELSCLFDQLEQAVAEKRLDRYEIVDEMIPIAAALARYLWTAEQK